MQRKQRPKQQSRRDNKARNTPRHIYVASPIEPDAWIMQRGSRQTFLVAADANEYLLDEPRV